ncbi:hypothetical protein [Kocuria rhizophila]|nr:hypothetical protein [Kocuria rhizophila]
MNRRSRHADPDHSGRRPAVILCGLLAGMVALYTDWRDGVRA